jgi:hypothetical protein
LILFVLALIGGIAIALLVLKVRAGRFPERGAG